jgi:hypothetical protein
MTAWLKLKYLENKIALVGEFGQHTKYRRLCHERNAKTAEEKLQIANEVIAGGATGIAECQAHTLYLQRHEKV